MNWFIENVWLVPLYPLIAALLIVLGRAFVREPGTQTLHGIFAKKELSMLLTVGATAIGLAHAVACIALLFQNGPLANLTIEHNIPWLTAGPLTFSIGYLIDPQSIMMLFVVTFISLLIQIYTHGYMEKDPGYCKFYAYLALFNFSMLGLVLSTNIFQIYIFWELVGVSSYLLIGFWFTRPSAGKAAIKAFIMNRIGDFGFLIGILIFLYYSFGWWQHQPNTALLAFTALAGPHGAASHVLAQAGPIAFAVMAVLIFMGPVAKSAQVPLHTWLPDAMEGPTPISALIHAATMVAAGIYLVARVYPIFQLSSTAMGIVATIGTLTAVIGATIALTQVDIKKALAYSTMSQLGFMMSAMGVGAFAAGLFHLFTHAFFKAMLFLCSGSVIHACEDEQDMRKMGGLAGKLPLTHLTYLIGTLSISGLFWTSGFWSKDEILVGAQNYSQGMYWILSLTAGLTAFYMFRTYFMTFTGKYRGEAHVHHETPVMTIPLVILAIPSLIIGYLLSGVAGGQFPSFEQYIHPSTIGHAIETVTTAGFLTPVGVRSMLFGLAGLILAFLLYGPKPVFNVDLIRRAARPLYALFSNKWYFDDIYQAFLDRVYLVFAECSAAFDRFFIDGIVNMAGRTVVSSGYAIKYMQTGKVQTYIGVLFFAVVVLSLALIYWLI